MEVGLLLFLYSFQQGHKPFLIIVYKPSNLLEIQSQVQYFVVLGSRNSTGIVFRVVTKGEMSDWLQCTHLIVSALYKVTPVFLMGVTLRKSLID
jgi:hypothetical protein